MVIGTISCLLLVFVIGLMVFSTHACDGDNYGPECTKLCSIRHCEGNSSCSSSTGRCDMGCEAGWTGDDCTGEQFLISIQPDGNAGSYYEMWPFAGRENHLHDKNSSVLVNVTYDKTSLYRQLSYSLFSPLPISGLGTKYIVSSCHPSGNYTSVLMIATHSQKTDVDITFTLEGNVFYDGRTYSDGDTLTLSLEEYQTFTIKSGFDLTGTVVNTAQSVAVFSYMMHNGVVCAFDQLLPVQYYGTEYVVAIDDNPALYRLQVVSEHSDTQIMFNNRSTVSVGKNGIYRESLTPNASLYFSSSRPVMTTLCRENNINPTRSSIAVVPPLSLYINRTTVVYYNVFKVLSDKNAGILVRNASRANIQLHWEEIPGSQYKIGTWRHDTPNAFYNYEISSNTGFTVLLFFSTTVYNGGYNIRTKPLHLVCYKETYGPDCSSTCSTRHCEGSSSCSDTTGQCDGGCQARWSGIDCTACDGDHYGPDCTKLCSTRHCKGDSSCNSSTGWCDMGCEAGWTVNDCTDSAGCIGTSVPITMVMSLLTMFMT